VRGSASTAAVSARPCRLQSHARRWNARLDAACEALEAALTADWNASRTALGVSAAQTRPTEQNKHARGVRRHVERVGRNNSTCLSVSTTQEHVVEVSAALGCASRRPHCCRQCQRLGDDVSCKSVREQSCRRPVVAGQQLNSKGWGARGSSGVPQKCCKARERAASKPRSCLAIRT
jgi:hypothetical protein